MARRQWTCDFGGLFAAGCRGGGCGTLACGLHGAAYTMDQTYRVEELTADVARLRISFVNVYFVGLPRARRANAGRARREAPGDAPPQWTLVDAGLSVGAAQIFEAATARFGQDARPAAIVLTHGHFDHVGALEALLRVWDVPVYAHRLELPFLTGRADYPPPDPGVGSGTPKLAPVFPERGIDLGDSVYALPSNGEVPGMPGWQWIHTPGHAPGHVSLFRAGDRMMLAGDALTTTHQESIFTVLTQRRELNGPPAYFTIDWESARQSVAAIAALDPVLVAAGHGEPLRVDSLAGDLSSLARDFDQRARPAHGRYVSHPVLADETGPLTLPPPARSGGVRWGMLSGVAAAAFAGTWLYRRFGRRSKLP